MDPLITDFEQSLVGKKEPSTVRAYTRVLKQFDAFLGGVSVLDVTQAKAYDFVHEQVGKASRSRRNDRRSVLRSLYKHLEMKGLADEKHNPTKAFEFETLKRRTVIPLNYTQMFRLLDVIENENPLYRSRNRAIVLTLFHCGLRVRELVSLNVDQLDDDTHLLFDVPRKGGDTMSSHLNNIVLPELQACRGDRTSLLSAARVKTDNEQALFVSSWGKRLQVRRLQALIERLGKKANIKGGLTPHVFRHSYASHLYELGVDIIEIQRLLGHKSITTTRGYIHRIPNNGDDKPEPSDLIGARWQKRYAEHRNQKQAAMAACT